MSFRIVSALLFLLVGCATAPTAPTVEAAAGSCAAGNGAPGDWLIGRWSHPYNILMIRREGTAIVYEWERKPGLVTERWGEKAPAKGQGQVTRIAGCEVEMKGSYTWSTTDKIVGQRMIYKLVLTAPNMLRGEWFGAGATWLSVSWLKEV